MLNFYVFKYKEKKSQPREHIQGQIMLLVFQSRSNREFSEVRDILEVKFGLVNRKKIEPLAKIF